MTTATPTVIPLRSASELIRRSTVGRVELMSDVVAEWTIPSHQSHAASARLIGEVADFAHTTDPDRVRGADARFFSHARAPKGDRPDGLPSAAPDLVVEVRSPSDGWNAVFLKVGEYLTAGVWAVVVLDVATRSASVYQTDARPDVFDADDDLTVPDVLPGFATPVGPLFG